MIRYNNNTLETNTNVIKPFKRADMFKGLLNNLDVKMSGRSTNIYPFGIGETSPYITIHRSVFEREPVWRFISFNVFDPKTQTYQSLILPGKVVKENAETLKKLLNIVKFLKEFIRSKQLDITKDDKKIHQYLASIIQRDFSKEY